MEEIFVVHGARTPFGTFMGEVRKLDPAELAIAAGREALRRAGLTGADVDSVIVGNVMQTDKVSFYLPKFVGLQLGAPDSIHGMAVNRLCGSGLQAVVSAAQAMRCGDASVVLAGGTEAMSRAPFILRGARDGAKGDQVLEDPLLGPHSVFVDPAVGLIMGDTAEEVALAEGISREQADAYALLSQERAAAAIASGRLAKEIVPVEVPARGGPVSVSQDEHPRKTSLEMLATLKPAFRKGGQVTPGNASGINDGAAMLVLATGSEVKARGLKPLAKLTGWAVTGISGRLMGLGPVSAIRKACDKAGVGLDQVDLVEINEAFAAQYLGCEAQLGLDRAKVNVNGGAIALGHPIGASGARLVLSLALELHERQALRGVASACIGGGQGIAVVLERV
jgi:acetyl-CoA acetyltransferase family protein